VAYALVVKVDGTSWNGALGFHLPAPMAPTWPDVATGFLVLAIPQLPLSLANSVLGTRQVLADLFPERRIGVRRISFTYSLMNLVSPFFGGIPTCHGAGGLAGHYAFGARTGGSVVIEGAFYAGLGLFLSGGFATVILLFPKPVLGIILLFEALALLRLTRDVAGSTADFSVTLLVGVIALALPYGYAVGLVAGTLVAAAAKRGITAFGRSEARGPEAPG
jgi:MFS superfamily sulfate permease-like transporter